MRDVVRNKTPNLPQPSRQVPEYKVLKIQNIFPKVIVDHPSAYVRRKLGLEQIVVVDVTTDPQQVLIPTFGKVPFSNGLDQPQRLESRVHCLVSRDARGVVPDGHLGIKHTVDVQEVKDVSQHPSLVKSEVFVKIYPDLVPLE